ncbi:alpha-ketoglutarate-dependent dioxygenase AlkB family protein [Rothia aerolata]|uniref:Alkylated DNA repair protein n=1 Tax=Rothia aerolata TaxID=1812262 RepID=A0A917MPG6_9MICC|nr:alpha-ketoglutarate-dependent dioxygenase AlkB [Rothia aerolata]GGH56288.1 alkylated DNA repair protein [Rothia aerolata]
MDSLFADSEINRPVREILPGVIHYPSWLSTEQQDFLVKKFFEWGSDSRGIPPHQPEIFGHKMSVRLTSLGWHWADYRYTRQAAEFGGASPLPVPDWMVRLGRAALADCYSENHASQWPRLGKGLTRWANSFTPDIALVNYYAPTAKMGMHQDKEERSDMPVVSLSIGDTAVFRAGNTLTKTAPYTDLLLASGDLLVFGGPSRFMYHGVPKVLPGTAPQDCRLDQGRINITLRETGLKDPQAQR